jgi:uncharacterized protein (UPF0276 family)
MNAPQTLGGPISGVGVGLRSQHVAHVLEHVPPVPWLELLADNWLNLNNVAARQLQVVSEHYPLTLHGVGLSLGGMDSLDYDYLGRIKQLKNSVNARWYSEHACFTSHGGYQFHDLCPLPGTEEAVAHLASRIAQAQDFLGERLLLENVSAYVRYHESQMGEGEFLREVAERADCLLLIDINNFYVNHVNHGSDVMHELNHLPAARIRELHLAGAEQQGNLLVDTHSRPIVDDVWRLYEKALEKWGPVPTLVEWDHDLPEWSVLAEEQRKASGRLSAVSPVVAF